jgi:hypothetical protein
MYVMGYHMIAKAKLEKLYLEEKLSMMEIARVLGCSPNRVTYWMYKHDIKRRSISDAVYQRANPNGDPFGFNRPETTQDYLLMGLGLGLYWGEGDKINRHSLRLGNTDPELLKMYMAFLVLIFKVDKDDLRFGLQVFTDINTQEALDYWVTALDVDSEQFYKPVVTVSGSLGTYRKKSQYGVVIVYFHNKKLRDIIIELLPR